MTTQQVKASAETADGTLFLLGSWEQVVIGRFTCYGQNAGQQAMPIAHFEADQTILNSGKSGKLKNLRIEATAGAETIHLTTISQRPEDWEESGEHAGLLIHPLEDKLWLRGITGLEGKRVRGLGIPLARRSRDRNGSRTWMPKRDKKGSAERLLVNPSSRPQEPPSLRPVGPRRRPSGLSSGLVRRLFSR